MQPTPQIQSLINNYNDIFDQQFEEMNILDEKVKYFDRHVSTNKFKHERMINEISMITRSIKDRADLLRSIDENIYLYTYLQFNGLTELESL